MQRKMELQKIAERAGNYAHQRAEQMSRYHIRNKRNTDTNRRRQRQADKHSQHNMQCQKHSYGLMFYRRAPRENGAAALHSRTKTEEKMAESSYAGAGISVASQSGMTGGSSSPEKTEGKPGRSAHGGGRRQRCRTSVFRFARSPGQIGKRAAGILYGARSLLRRRQAFT